jgi:predicted nuclease of predicted toxin-antitoxin system
MKIWLDAQLSPALAPWMSAQFAVSAVAVRDLGLRDSADREIFFAAREALAILITKDSDFVRLLENFGPPPRVIWLTFGNTSNARLKKIFAQTLTRALDLIQAGEIVVEISARWPGGADTVL